jgi:hypothetical protein
MAPWIRRLAVAAALIGLAGCAAKPAIPYDRPSAGDIKIIGILTPSFPDGPKIIRASDIGMSFGLIGGLIDLAMLANRDSNFTAMLASQSYSAADAFPRALAASVEAQGYKVEMIPVTRDPDKGFLDNYQIATNIKADAYLDVAVGVYGYVAAGMGDETPYRPLVSLGCKLVRVGSGSVLMRDTIVYNPVNPADNLITISPDPAYSFADFDALMADPTKATAGLDGALKQSAQAVGKLLH